MENALCPRTPKPPWNRFLAALEMEKGEGVVIDRASCFFPFFHSRRESVSSCVSFNVNQPSCQDRFPSGMTNRGHSSSRSSVRPFFRPFTTHHQIPHSSFLILHYLLGQIPFGNDKPGTFIIPSFSPALLSAVHNSLPHSSFITHNSSSLPGPPSLPCKSSFPLHTLPQEILPESRQ
jgi:hypothetical protein